MEESLLNLVANYNVRRKKGLQLFHHNFAYSQTWEKLKGEVDWSRMHSFDEIYETLKRLAKKCQHPTIKHERVLIEALEIGHRLGMPIEGAKECTCSHKRFVRTMYERNLLQCIQLTDWYLLDFLLRYERKIVKIINKG